jgi:ATP diphosphatase
MSQTDTPATHYSLQDLLRVMERLRDPDGGCPWDLKQNFKSIVPSTLEECYELADAIERSDLAHIADELGDVLFQVIFYSQLGAEQGAFDFEGVVDGLVKKLIRRHPHVFANGDIEGQVQQLMSSAEVKANWEAIKQAERDGKAQAGVLADVPVALPALPRAQKLQKRAANIGFDWVSLEAVVNNLEDELVELRHALDSGNPGHIADEFGDVLFSAVNLGRHLELDSEAALRRANSKFEKRFTHMEMAARKADQSLRDLSIDQLESLWKAAKLSE